MVNSRRITQQELTKLAEENNRPYQSVLAAYVPESAMLLVTSKGDEKLLSSLGRKAHHFPQTEEGWYAGAHPADSKEAIEHLESLRDRGAQFLLFPYTSMWWLDHYKEFADHLERHHSLLSRDVNHALFAI